MDEEIEIETSQKAWSEIDNEISCVTGNRILYSFNVKNRDWETTDYHEI